MWDQLEAVCVHILVGERSHVLHAKRVEDSFPRLVSRRLHLVHHIPDRLGLTIPVAQLGLELGKRGLLRFGFGRGRGHPNTVCNRHAQDRRYTRRGW